MNAINMLESVLCDPEGKCCITGSEADRKIVDDAITELRAALAQPEQAENLFEFWWAEYMPKETQSQAWAAWQAALQTKNITVQAVAQQILAADGWRLVPIEPTYEMMKAGGHVNSEWLNDDAPIGELRYVVSMAGAYAAMLRAAPVPKATGETP